MPTETIGKCMHISKHYFSRLKKGITVPIPGTETVQIKGDEEWCEVCGPQVESPYSRGTQNS